MASTRSWCGRHELDIGAERAPERGKAFHRGSVGALRRREDAPAADEQLGEARVGTGMLGAGDRMGRDKMHAGGKCGAMSRTIAPLTEPTSDTVAPAASLGPISSAISPQTPTGAQTMTRSRRQRPRRWFRPPGRRARARQPGAASHPNGRSPRSRAPRPARAPRARSRSRSGRRRSAPGDGRSAGSCGLGGITPAFPKIPGARRRRGGSLPRCRRSCAARWAACRR